MVLDGSGSVYDDTGWYLVGIRWYCLVLGGTGLTKGLYACIYWNKSGDTDAGHIHRQENIELLSLSKV